MHGIARQSKEYILCQVWYGLAKWGIYVRIYKVCCTTRLGVEYISAANAQCGMARLRVYTARTPAHTHPTRTPPHTLTDLVTTN